MYFILSSALCVYVCVCARLGNLVTGFMISDESGNRFFPTAVTDYWQDRAGIAYQQTDFSEFFANLRTFSYVELSTKSDSVNRVSLSSQKLHNVASNRSNIQHSRPLW